MRIILCRDSRGSTRPVCTILSTDWPAWKEWRKHSGSETIRSESTLHLELINGSDILEYTWADIPHNPHLK